MSPDDLNNDATSAHFFPPRPEPTPEQELAELRRGLRQWCDNYDDLGPVDQIEALLDRKPGAQ